MKHTLVRAALLGTGMALVLAVGVRAQDRKLSDTDRKFMMMAAQGNLLEVRLGELAFERGASPAVKKFGQRMVKDHSKAFAELKKLASKHGVTLPRDLDTKHQGEAEKFAKLKGADFDKAYAQHMLAEHQKDVAKFQREAKEVRDPGLRMWTEQTLPVLQEHLQLARKLKVAER